MAEWLKPMANLGAIMPAPGHIGATDHLSFLDVGVPGFQAVQEYINYDVRTHHTNVDIAERIDPNALKQAATVMAVILYQASMREGTFPKPARRSPRRSQRARSSNMAGIASWLLALRGGHDPAGNERTPSARG